MPLIQIGGSQQELHDAYAAGQRAGYAAALGELHCALDGLLLDRLGPTQAAALGRVAQLLVDRLGDAWQQLAATQYEINRLRRWEAALRADPLFEQVQRARQELKDEQAQCVELTRDLTQKQKQLREEKAVHLTDIRARDTRITELNDLVARLTLKRLEPLEEAAASDKVAEDEN